MMMYSLPELYNVDNRLCPVDEDDIQVCREETIPRQNIPCDETVKDLCVLIMEEYHLSSQSDDSDVASAKQLYLRLRDVVRSVL